MTSKEKILVQTKKLFADKGFSKVSMRNIAKAVNMSVAAIYHHFPNKNILYLETIQYAFSDKALIFTDVWKSNISAGKQLILFVNTLVRISFSDREFHRLIQREILDNNPERMKMLAEDVFKEQFNYLLLLMKKISPDKDVHLSAISILVLCKHHIEMQTLSRFLPEWKQTHDTPEVIAEHIIELLFNGLREKDI